MRGHARTVFAGTEIESFELEVLGIMRDLVGPGQDIILVRLLGEKPTYTGVVAGMSGSPVYINGRLAGAIALRFGAFTKEPIAGVTPIENMLRAAQEKTAAVAESDAPRRYLLPDDALAAAGLRNVSDPYLVPIETPLTFVGFHPEVIRRFAPELEQYGLLAVQGGGRAAADRTAPLEPGGAVSAALITGDVSIAGTCTVTHRIGDQLFACGHWILGYGDVQIPMARAEIVHTVASELASFKIANIGEVVGRFEQDRRSAIVGRLGAPPPMVPVDLTIVHNGQPRKYHFEIFQHPKLSPLLLNIGLFNSLFAAIETGEEMSYRVSGRMAVRGFPDVVIDDLFSPTDSGIPDAFFVVNNVGNTFRRVFTNPYQMPAIEGLDLTVELLPDRLYATIENAWTDRSEVSPGENIVVKVVLRPYRGPRQVRDIPITIPLQAPRGDLRILVSDATLLNAITRTFLLGGNFPGAANFGRRINSLEQLITVLNRERRSNRLYLSLFQPTPTLLVEDKILPSAPLSQINVLSDPNMAFRPGGGLLFYESILNEASEPLGVVITGSQWLRITVR